MIYRVQEESDPDNDTFAVTVAVSTSPDAPIEWLGGFISGWSTFTPEVQAIVKADMYAEADKQLEAWRRTHP